MFDDTAEVRRHGYGQFHRTVLCVAFLLFLTGSPTASAQSFSGVAFVRDDGTLSISNRTIHLWGIHIPLEDETCFTFMRPVRCGPRSVLALSMKIDGFVQCRMVRERADGSFEAQCRTNGAPFAEGDDLAAFLLENGWALARPEAPFEYHALERIARHRNIGIWGIPRRRP